ncbi:MAG: hypothetical protein HZB16_23580, partial [Armatimonadetes bacterium]|nr:hypothetical protein [Armatimonadota bacterium]
YPELFDERAPEVERPYPKRPLPLVPPTIRQAALGCPVTSSAKLWRGSLAQITDGRKEPDEDGVVELSPKTQWVHIDLRRSLELWDVVVWHYHWEPIAVRDVVVQVSDDPRFETGVTTLFNNDRDNSSKLGQGTDREYVETHLPKVIDGRRTTARYVRLYSRGSDYSDSLNRYTEVEVWATDRPAGPDWVPLPIAFPRPSYGLDGPALAEQDRAMASDADPSLDPVPAAPPPTPLVPPRTTQLARGRPVTSGAKVFGGSLAQITDGQKEAHEGTNVELSPRGAWVQIDLGASHELYYIALWHYFLDPVIVSSVVVQVCDDPSFMFGVTTLYNSDRENRLGQGVGTDKRYWETNRGRLIDARRTQARYVRCWSRGSTYTDALNRWTEVEVWGTPEPETRRLSPLPIDYPRREFLGDAVYYDVPRIMADPRYAGRLELYPREAPPTPQAPRGVKQLAGGRSVTTSSTPRVGHPSLVTDGDKEDHGDAGLEMPPGSQWVQIDLGESRELYYVALWHRYLDLAIVQGVLVQLSDDPTFATGVATLYNNDTENRHGQGTGLDKLYWATHCGRLIDARRTRARYVRCWSSGSGFTDGLSHWLEVEVWGL